MYVLNRQKYSKRNPDLRARLLRTNDATLIEGNTWGDEFFGLNLKTGSGKNGLGRILMRIRDEIAAEEKVERAMEPLSPGPVIA